MLAPERRTPADVAAAAVIAVVVVIAAVLVWHNSEARGTVSRVAAQPAASLPAATKVPDTVRELWHDEDGANHAPVTVGGVVVTADGGAVTGRLPATGAELWRYRRDTPLCGVQGSWGFVVAVYRDRRGCGQASELSAATGARVTARSSPADPTVTLSNDNSYIVSQGSRRLEVWRSDLVRTLEYGHVDAAVNPQSQQRPDCAIQNATMNGVGSRLVVLHKCPGEPVQRLTVLNPAPKDPQKPEEFTSALVPNTPPGAGGGRLLAATADVIAMYLPADAAAGPRITVYDTALKQLAEYPLSAPAEPPARAARVGYDYMFWTGSTTVALSPTNLAPLWTVPDALGPGTLMAGHFLIPVTDGIAVLDTVRGHELRRIPVQRNGYHGPIESNVIGNVILEQRGAELVALG